MFRYLLPVVATALLAGCHCGMFGCAVDEDLHWDASHQAADQLWEAERDRIERTPVSEAAPDTTDAPDRLSVHPVPEETRTLWWLFVVMLRHPSACSPRSDGIDERNDPPRVTCPSGLTRAELEVNRVP